MHFYFTNRIKSRGGPSTFQHRFIEQLKIKKIKTSFNFSLKADYVFVNSGTRKLISLIILKLIGVKIIQRLDGYNHNFKVKKNPFKIIIKAQIQNFIISFIRKFLANKIIYQSKYSKKIWEKRFGKVLKPNTIIYNSSSSEFFKNYNNKLIKNKKFKIIIIEGNIQMENLTLNILKCLNKIACNNLLLIDSIQIYGNSSNVKNYMNWSKKIEFKGTVQRKNIYKIYKQNNCIFFLLDFYSNCSNSLIESITSRVPTLYFDSGSANELAKNCGYKINFNDLDYINERNFLDYKIIHGLKYIMRNYTKLQANCYFRSKHFKSEYMSKKYLNFISLKEH